MVAMLAPRLNELAGAGQWNFDLDDCDRILRVTAIVSPLEVVGLLASYGIACAELEDFIPEPWMMPTKVACPDVAVSA